MPYSVNSYSNVGGSPFQQYMDQQRQQYLAYQQSLQPQQNQNGQQGQQNPPFGGQNQPIQGFQGNQQNYGGYPQPGAFQYNPLQGYNMQGQNQQPQPQNQGNSLQRGFGGIENPNPVLGQYKPPANTSQGEYTNPYAVNPSTQPYSPFQSYGMFTGSPSGGTGNFDYSMFNYY